MIPLAAGLKKNLLWLLLLMSVLLLVKVWTASGYDSFYFDSDLARDLKELSNIHQGNIVWLGPWLAPGLHASSSYYYFFYPALALAGGKVSALITFNIFLGVVAVAGFGLLAIRHYQGRGLIGSFWLGLLPVITNNILHPGNGFSYLYFTLISLTALWFKVPLAVASFTAGMAIALHPAAGFLPLFLLSEWWRRGRSWLSALISSVVFLVPLAPLIGFEIITKGYIIRNWLSKPSTNDIGVRFSFHNFNQVSDLLGLAPWLLLTLLIFSGYLIWRQSSSRLKIWFGLGLVVVTATLFFDHVLWRYLFGVALIVAFVIGVTLIRYRLTSLILVALIVKLFIFSPLFHPQPPAARTITQVEAIADAISTQLVPDRTQKIAVVAAVTPQTEVPQADDYRYLLRSRGHHVVDVTEHAQADLLLMVIEVPTFDWAGWSNWEIQSFGEKEVSQVEVIDQTTVVIFKRQSGT